MWLNCFHGIKTTYSFPKKSKPNHIFLISDTLLNHLNWTRTVNNFLKNHNLIWSLWYFQCIIYTRSWILFFGTESFTLNHYSKNPNQTKSNKGDNRIFYWIILIESRAQFESSHGDIWNFTEFLTLGCFPKNPNCIKPVWWFKGSVTMITKLFFKTKNNIFKKSLQFKRYLGRKVPHIQSHLSHVEVSQVWDGVFQ